MFVAVLHGNAATIGELIHNTDIELECEFSHLIPKVQRSTFDADNTLILPKDGKLTIPSGEYAWIEVSENTELDILDCSGVTVKSTFECMARKIGRVVYPHQVDNSVYAFYHAGDVLPKSIAGKCELDAEPDVLIEGLPDVEELVLLGGGIRLRTLWRCESVLVAAEHGLVQMQHSTVFRDKLGFILRGYKQLAQL